MEPGAAFYPYLPEAAPAIKPPVFLYTLQPPQPKMLP